MPKAIVKLAVAIGGVLVCTAPAQARRGLNKNIAAALVPALNHSQHLRKYPATQYQRYTMDFRVKPADFKQARSRTLRAPKRDIRGMKAYAFGARVVTPHTKAYDGGSEIMATAVRRVVGIALIDAKGKTIIDASTFRVRRLDPPPKMY